MEPDRAVVALAYERGDAAPRVVAKGRGAVAQAILAAARAHGVPVHEAAGLVPLLMRLEPDQAVPPALYVAVAEVLAYVERVRRRLPPPR